MRGMYGLPLVAKWSEHLTVDKSHRFGSRPLHYKVLVLSFPFLSWEASLWLKGLGATPFFNTTIWKYLLVQCSLSYAWMEFCDWIWKVASFCFCLSQGLIQILLVGTTCCRPWSWCQACPLTWLNAGRVWLHKGGYMAAVIPADQERQSAVGCCYA